MNRRLCLTPIPWWSHDLEAHCLRGKCPLRNSCCLKKLLPLLTFDGCSFPISYLISLMCSFIRVCVSGGYEREAGHLVMPGTRITIITVNINRDPIAGEFKHGFSIFIEAINIECAAKCLLWLKSEQCLLALKCIFRLVDEVEGFTV